MPPPGAMPEAQHLPQILLHRLCLRADRLGEDLHPDGTPRPGTMPSPLPDLILTVGPALLTQSWALAWWEEVGAEAA